MAPPTQPHRPVEEQILDPWAEISLEQAKLATITAQAKIDAAKTKADRRHTAAVAIGYGVAALVVLVIVAGFFYGIITHEQDRNIRLDEIKVSVEQEQTKQVQACSTLTEPTERQLCILHLGLPEEANR